MLQDRVVTNQKSLTIAAYDCYNWSELGEEAFGETPQIWQKWKIRGT
jgi:hypothetical protein